ncbi:type II secretion system F family protein [Spirillospora albida]|uniref:type II secretion system F family protein n=1 Tax=Spirillospora albida TaxID=58123 RepID=UPI0004C1926B|nr:type II secretion system F family protein [Spirillospora albida]
MSTTSISAALCSFAAVWLLLGRPTATRRLDRLLAPKPSSLGHLHDLRSRLEQLKRQRNLPALWRTSVIELCDGMAAELAAGRTPDDAFTTSASVLDPPVSAALLETRPPPLERLAEQRGAEGLRLLAACWRVGSERGGTLAAVLDGLAAALRDEEAQRQEVTVQLAGPRATARLLAALPLVGLAMAAAMGARPLGFLFGTLPGLACLLTGVALNLAGLYWTRRMARSAHSA